MRIADRRHALTRIPAVRTTLVATGFVLMILSPLAGILPGPGGILVFAGGLALVLRYSQWAKRKYVVFKRSHPRKAAWADWGLRRQSALRRQARDKAQQAAARAAPPEALGAVSEIEVVEVRTVTLETLTIERTARTDGADPRKRGDATGDADRARSR